MISQTMTATGQQRCFRHVRCHVRYSQHPSTASISVCPTNVRSSPNSQDGADILDWPVRADIVAKRVCSPNRARLMRRHGNARLIRIFCRSGSIVADSYFTEPLRRLLQIRPLTQHGQHFHAFAIRKTHVPYSWLREELSENRNAIAVDHHVSVMWTRRHRDDADQRLPVLLRLQGLWRPPQTQSGRLLRFLLVWLGAVSAGPTKRQVLRIDAICVAPLGVSVSSSAIYLGSTVKAMRPMVPRKGLRNQQAILPGHWLSTATVGRPLVRDATRDSPSSRAGLLRRGLGS